MNSSVSDPLVTAPVAPSTSSNFVLKTPDANIASLDFQRRSRPQRSRHPGSVWSTSSASLFAHRWSSFSNSSRSARSISRTVSPGPIPTRLPASWAPWLRSSVAVTTHRTRPPFTWNGVTWSGNSAVSIAVLNADVTVKPGDLVDGMKLEAMWDAAREEYAKAGYLDMSTPPSPNSTIAPNASPTTSPSTKARNIAWASSCSPDFPSKASAAFARPGASRPAPSLTRTSTRSSPLPESKQAFAGLPFHYEKIGRFLRKSSKGGTVDVLIDFQ